MNGETEPKTNATKSDEGRRRGPKITPRQPRMSFGDLPRHWIHGRAALTHVSNAVNLLFPKGERFFVRSVKHYEHRIQDPELREDVRGFYAQEGRHAGAHERFNQALRDQGFDIDTFLARYDRLIALLEGVSPLLNLSATAALEHFTAMLAEDALGAKRFDAFPPEMKTLLGWHSVEELEHKAVAFDVLQEVSPEYTVRMAGLAMGVVCLGGLWAYGALMLAQQDGLDVRTFLTELGEGRRALKHERTIARDLFWKGIRDYARRDFHPNDHDTSDLVREFLADWAPVRDARAA